MPLGEILKQAWGYQPGLDYPSLSICDLSTAFTHLIARMDPNKFSQAPQFLKDAGVKIRSSKKVDLDGDGKMEWVLLIDTPGDDAAIGIWILQHSGEGVQALLLVPWTRRGFALPKKLSGMPAWDVRTVVSPEGKTVGFIQAGDYLYAIELNQVDKAIDHLLWGLRDVESYTVQSSGNNLELRVVLTTPDCQHCTEIYPWMDGEFTYIFSGEPDPSKAQEAEDTLLVDWMPAKAIPLLEEILAKTPNPRLVYLLGLAYELEGNETNAVKAYWQVWHQFPESAYSRLAQAKLELKR